MTTHPTGLPPHIKTAESTEEQKFKNKFPGKKPASTDFLRMRLQKGVKYFDSGDYAMAKSTSKTGPNPLLGKAIPTPEAVTQRKHSTASKSRLVDGEHPTSPTEEKTVLLRQKEANPTHQEEEEEKQ